VLGGSRHLSARLGATAADFGAPLHLRVAFRHPVALVGATLANFGADAAGACVQV